MPTVFLDVVFKPFFKIVPDTGQQLTIDRKNFLTDGFLQITQRTGFVSVNTRFQIPPKEKITLWKIGRARGPRHVSETGNEVPGKHVSNNGHWLFCSVRCGTILLKVANPEEKNADHLVPHPLRLPTEYYTFKRCQVPVGHSVYSLLGGCYTAQIGSQLPTFLNGVVIPKRQQITTHLRCVISHKAKISPTQFLH